MTMKRSGLLLVAVLLLLAPKVMGQETLVQPADSLRSRYHLSAGNNAGSIFAGICGEALDGLFELNGGGETISQGRFVRLNLALPPRDGLVAIPYEALYGVDRVYVVDGESRLRPIAVRRIGETRVADGSMRVLIEAPSLESGAQLVTTQLPNALDGLLVKIAAS